MLHTEKKIGFYYGINIPIKNKSIKLKIKSSCQRIWFLPQTLIFLSLFLCKPICQNMNSVRSNVLSLKYVRFTLSGCQDKGIAVKTQFLSS